MDNKVAKINLKNEKSPKPGNTNSELTEQGGRNVLALVKKLNKILQGDRTEQKRKQDI
jgi:hypothetical protein